MQQRVIITCQPDDLHPERVFRVMSGSIADSTSDLVVVSAHANGALPASFPERSRRWGGAALAGVVAACGESAVTHLKRYVRFEGGGGYSLGPVADERCAEWGGVWAAPMRSDATDTDLGRWLVVVRVPSVLDDDAAALRTVLAAVFGVTAAIAANRGAPFRSVALSNLFAERPFDPAVRVAALLRQVRSWYGGGMAADAVDVVLYDRDPEALAEMSEAWAAGVRDVLGWSPVAHDPATDALRREVRDRVSDHLRAGAEIPVMHPMLEELHLVLDPERPRSLQEIARAGRSLAEAFSAELCHAYALPYKPQAFANLEALSRLADHDSAVDQVARKAHVARWIVSYLHTLRTLGNEASHVVQEREGRFPHRLESDDLIVLLSHIRRVLDFRLRWRAFQLRGV